MIDVVRIETDEESNAWDSLIFTVQWPVTTCLMWKESGRNHSCILPDRDTWTVHGIW